MIQNILDQAKFFLESADEFFPFGCNIDQNNMLHPFSVYFETDRPDSMDVINESEKAIKFNLKENKYKLAAIGIDVNITNEETLQKISAIQIRTYTLNSMEAIYFKYQKKEKEYFFEKIQILNPLNINYNFNSTPTLNINAPV